MSPLTLDIPEDVLFRWCSVKNVESDRVHAILLHNLLGVQTVVFRLAHLLPCHLNTTAVIRHWLLIWKRQVRSQRSKVARKSCKLFRSSLSFFVCTYLILNVFQYCSKPEKYVISFTLTATRQWCHFPFTYCAFHLNMFIFESFILLYPFGSSSIGISKEEDREIFKVETVCVFSTKIKRLSL